MIATNNNTMIESKLAALARRILELTDANRELQLGLARHDIVNRSLEVQGRKAGVLLEESHHLQNNLQEITRQLLSAKEEGRKKMSLRLQDGILQTLEGIHLRLLVLNREVSASSEDFQNEIAITQKLAQQSLEIISNFAHECGAEA